ncbi:carboxymuconolactone decarboxylase family protein [Mycobacterium sp. 4D054]|uniref:carboxymuconolactone decarboxylase family protein n=1 Tax=Mycobacterium sp. 4D054 TaxID=3457440 RepID=UPI003FD0B086
MRLTPLPAEQWDDDVVRALSVMMPPERAQPDKVGNMLATFARHPRLTKAYLTFNMHLLVTTTLPKRITETVVLRTAVCRGSEYLWDHHVPLATRAGLTDDEVDGIRSGVLPEAIDAAVLAAVDELHSRAVVSEDTWRRLSEHLDEQQLMDLVFTAGGYGTLAMAIETFGIEDEA